MLKQKLMKLLFFTILVTLPHNVKGYCDNEEKVRLKKIASNINVSYNYEIKNSDAIFSVDIDNLFDEVYLVTDFEKKVIYDKYESTHVVLSNLQDGQTYKIDVYANGGVCANEYLHTIYINTPKYNKYYTYDVCDDAKEYKLCQRWATHSFNSMEFVENVNEYKMERDKIVVSDEEENKMTYILDFFRDYYMYIILGVVIVIVIIKYIRYKRDSFGF